MTVRTFFRNLWDNAFPPADAALSISPPAEPELSCFVKGVIRSMETEPGNWRTDLYGDLRHCCFEHSGTNLCIWYHEWGGGKPTANIHDVDLIATERHALGQALRRSVIEPMIVARIQAVAQQAAEQKAKMAPAVRHFSELGCPLIEVRAQQ